MRGSSGARWLRGTPPTFELYHGPTERRTISPRIYVRSHLAPLDPFIRPFGPFPREGGRAYRPPLRRFRRPLGLRRRFVVSPRLETRFCRFDTRWLGQPNPPCAPLHPAGARRALHVRAFPPEIHQYGHDRRAEEQP